MRAPSFWSNPPERPGWQARLLAPAAALWQLGGWIRQARARPWRAPVPVICVGNLTAGGGGKTPMVAALLGRLVAHTPHVVSRGHGGRQRGPHRVGPEDTAAEVGDEPLLLARHGPVWVARDRAAGARAAVGAGAGLILLDDGFQNPNLIKDISLLMIDAGQGFGNGRIIPAGPLREPVAAGLARADAAVLVGDRPLDLPLPAFRAQPMLDAAGIPDQPVLAFAGIARPAKFYDSLRARGTRIAGTRDFPDHHPFTLAEIDAVLAEAARLGATPVTTEKDAVRLPAAHRDRVRAVPMRLELDDWAGLDRLIATRLGAR